MNIAYNTAVVLCGASLLGACAGLIGNFAVLRKRALTGDALAHAALPGVCVAFLLLEYLLQFPSLKNGLAAVGIADSRSLPALLLGALCSGILGVAVISGLRRWTRVKEDAAIGIVLGVFFGAGIVLLRLIQNSSTGNKAGLQSFILGKTAGMVASDVYLIAGMGAVCLLLVLLLYKEFKLTIFDPGFATAQGWPVLRLDLLVMSLVAVAVVIGLPAVGAILMASLLILPAAAARFWTDRFGRLLMLSVVFGAITGLVGAAVSATFEKLPAGPIIILAGTALFLISVFFAPRRGLIARGAQQWKFRRDLLAGNISPSVDEPLVAEAFESVDSEAEQTAAIVSADLSAVSSPTSDPVPGVISPRRTEATAQTVPPRHFTLRRIFTAIACLVMVAYLVKWFVDSDSLAKWTVIIGCLTNIPCAVLGCFLVLRRMSLLGDAISHAVLPGIALAFLFSGLITGWPILLGAMIVGVLTAFFTHTLHAIGRVPEDSSLGIVYSAMFAAGVIMITRFAAQTDLDPDCVLYGLLEFAPLDTIRIAGMTVPRALPTLLGTTLFSVGFVAAFWKELKIGSFDSGLATAMGFNGNLIHYMLMASVAAVVVSAFEAVGSVLVIAMLIVPPATAQLLTDRLSRMVFISVGVAVLSAVIGDAVARSLNTNVAAMMAVVAGAQFALAVFFAPRYGLVSKWLRNLQLALRIAAEDVIGRLYRAEEAKKVSTEIPVVTQGLAGLLAVPWLKRRGHVSTAQGHLALTNSGREVARSVIRSHRLWETYLGEQTALPLDHLHAPAERMEHYIGKELQEKIAASLPADKTDPHGREIPRTPTN